jgi:ribosomal protein L11 methyltransferase
MNYIEVEFKLKPFKPWDEVFVAYLSELSFESFQEENHVLRAYVSENDFDQSKFHALLDKLELQNDFEFSYQVNNIPQQNWNAVWESQFEPVVIDNKLQIIAPFHSKNDFLGQTIIIEPKMSFGTGHHQTTYMMCKMMFELNLQDKVVLDMGSGTGILAILAEKLGAKNIKAYDIESWSVENCSENAKKNDCSKIESLLGDIDQVDEEFDIILANINKNVLKNHMPYYSKLLKSNGKLLLSGFFVSDEPELKSCSEENGFIFQISNSYEGWSMLQFFKCSSNE